MTKVAYADSSEKQSRLFIGIELTFAWSPVWHRYHQQLNVTISRRKYSVVLSLLTDYQIYPTSLT